MICAVWPVWSECGLCCEIMRDDGTMMRTAELLDKAEEWGLAVITIKDLQDYCRRHDKHVVREANAKMPTRFGEFQHHAATSTT